jgi:hypothetical protein
MLDSSTANDLPTENTGNIAEKRAILQKCSAHETFSQSYDFGNGEIKYDDEPSNISMWEDEAEPIIANEKVNFRIELNGMELGDEIDTSDFPPLSSEFK